VVGACARSVSGAEAMPEHGAACAASNKGRQPGGSQQCAIQDDKAIVSADSDRLGKRRTVSDKANGVMTSRPRITTIVCMNRPSSQRLNQPLLLLVGIEARVSAPDAPGTQSAARGSSRSPNIAGAPTLSKKRKSAPQWRTTHLSNLRFDRSYRFPWGQVLARLPREVGGSGSRGASMAETSLFEQIRAMMLATVCGLP